MWPYRRRCRVVHLGRVYPATRVPSVVAGMSRPAAFMRILPYGARGYSVPLLYRERLPVVVRGHRVHGTPTIGPQVHQTATLRSLRPEGVCLFPAGHFGQQVDRGDEVFGTVQQRRRIRLEIDMAAIWPFSHGPDAAYGSPL